MQRSVPAQPFLGSRRALVGAVILGAIAAGLIVAFLANREPEAAGIAAPGESVTVVFATEDIAAGTTIAAEMLQERPVPRELLVAGALTRAADVAGEVARYPIARGEQVSSTRLVEAPTSKSVSFQIPAGMRGFTIDVNVNNSPAALLAPGDFVDVIVTGELVTLSGEPGGTAPTPVVGDAKPKAALTLLQNVQVLSVQRNYVDNGVVYDSSTRGDPPAAKDNVSYVMLALTPEQVQLLWLASQESKVTLALRPFGDDVITDLPPVTEPLRIQVTSGR